MNVFYLVNSLGKFIKEEADIATDDAMDLMTRKQ
jgi:hypothetical protein